MHSISISDEIKSICPSLRLACLSCEIKISIPSDALNIEIEKTQEKIRNSLEIDQVSSHPVNGQTRDGYRACGKKPGRYRPSAEALIRRVLQGKDWYSINNVVDTINLVSARTGFSIGGYDIDKIQGDINLSIGKENEPYIGLGRGELNIHRLPVFRDNEGAFGSPTSDSERTGIRENTTSFLMIFLDFGGNEMLEPSLEIAKDYLTDFCSGANFEIKIIA